MFQNKGLFLRQFFRRATAAMLSAIMTISIFLPSMQVWAEDISVTQESNGLFLRKESDGASNVIDFKDGDTISPDEFFQGLFTLYDGSDDNPVKNSDCVVEIISKKTGEPIPSNVVYAYPENKTYASYYFLTNFSSQDIPGTPNLQEYLDSIAPLLDFDITFHVNDKTLTLHVPDDLSISYYPFGRITQSSMFEGKPFSFSLSFSLSGTKMLLRNFSKYAKWEWFVSDFSLDGDITEYFTISKITGLPNSNSYQNVFFYFLLLKSYGIWNLATMPLPFPAL